jgi:hypothetical protein
VPNWESADYACPRVVTTKAGEHNFLYALLYEYNLRYGIWNYLVPGAREHVDHDFDPSKEQAYLFCAYQALPLALIVAAKEAKHCSFVMGLCWKGDPYNFRTPASSTFYSDKLPDDKLPDWDAIEYACPLSIKVKSGTHKFRGYETYAYSSGEDWIHTSGRLIKRHRVFAPPKQQEPPPSLGEYVVCHYADTDVGMMMKVSPP